MIKNNNFWKILWAVKVQITIILLITILQVLSFYKIIPSSESLTQHLTALFEKNGLGLIALCSFIENIVGLNVYFPGSIVILSGMTLTAGYPVKAIVTFLFIYIPSVLSHFVNYFIGFYFSKSSPYTERKFKNRSNSRIWLLFFSTLWHPHFSALTSLAAGYEGLKFKYFIKYFITVSLFWNIFWGLAMYFGGLYTGLTRNLLPLFYIYLIIWLFWDVKKYVAKQDKT